MTKVLVGIASKDRAEILPKALESALAQDLEHVTVSVFDDNSSDGTRMLEPHFPTVKWLFSDTTKGYVFARNYFLSLGFDYYASLDDDSWFLEKGSLMLAVDYLQKNPDVGAVAFEILTPDDAEVLTAQPVTPVETNMFIGCGHLLRVEVVNRLGNYPPNPGFYGGEEKDLCIRLINAGFKIVKLKGVYVWHEKTSKSRNIQKQHRSGVCNDLVFMWRRTPLVLLIPAMVTKLYKHLAFSVRYKNSLLLKPGLLGIKDFFAHLFSLDLQREAVTMRAFRKYMSLN